MMEKLFFKNLNFYIFLSICLSCITFAAASFDTTFFYHWYTFFLWMISLFIVPVFFCVQKKSAIIRSIKTFFKSNHAIPFLFIIFLAIIFSFSFLVRYPYVSIYDQVRDGGLNAQEILNGSIKNIFGYGRYSNTGLLVPILTGFFYLFFKNSVLTFRFPAAFIATIDVISVYLVTYTLINKRAAFWSAIILLTIPLHIFYGRTEVIVIWTSAYTTFLLYLFGHFLKRKTRMYYILLGLFIGLSGSFYIAVKIVAYMIMLFVICITQWDILKKKYTVRKEVDIVSMLFFFFIGFGPILLFTSTQNFFIPNDLPGFQNIHSIPIAYMQNLDKIIIAYKNSLLVYVGQPLWSTSFPVFKTLINPFLSFFFLIGIIFAIFRSKNSFLKFLVCLSLIIPFTHSALTGGVNSDPRLSPLLPIVAILAAFGIENSFCLLKKISRGKAIFFLQLALCVFIIEQGISFFLNETATKQYTLSDYVSMHTIYFVNDNTSYNNTKTLCLAVSPNRYNYLQNPSYLLLVSEQYEYFFPGKTISIYEGKNIRNNETYIASSCNTPKTITTYIFCRQNEKFTCVDNQQIKILSGENTKGSNQNENNFFTKNPPFIIYPTPRFIP